VTNVLRQVNRVTVSVCDVTQTDTVTRFVYVATWLSRHCSGHLVQSPTDHVHLPGAR